MKGVCREGRNGYSDRLDRGPDVVNEAYTASHEDVARAEQGQVRLSQFAAMLDRAEQLAIEARDASQVLGVDLIVLALILVDQAQLSRVSHDHLVTELRQKTTDPWGVHACFDGDHLSLTPASRSSNARAVVATRPCATMAPSTPIAQ